MGPIGSALKSGWVLKQIVCEGLIALTACLGGEVPDKIVNEGEEKGEEALLELKEKCPSLYFLFFVRP